MFAGTLIVSEALAAAYLIAKLACQQWPCIVGQPQLFMHRENTVYKVETTLGAAALRVHRFGYHDKIDIESELQWMAHLAQNGLQVPAPIANEAGSFLTEVSVSGRTHIIDLLTWLDGEALGASNASLTQSLPELEDIFFNLGVGMARLHNISDGWSPPENFKRHAWDRDGFVGEAPFWGRFWEASGLSPEEQSTLQSARTKAAQKLDRFKKAGGDYGLIHADFVRQNILVTGTQTRFIDFDDSGFGFRMYDFATALVKNRDEPHYQSIKSSLLAGYRSIRGLSELNEGALDFFLTLRDFAYLGWMDERRAEPGVELRLPKVRQDTLAAAIRLLAH
jgi:Ser/Thr protein kinase RdoA (MazF antagonist)